MSSVSNDLLLEQQDIQLNQPSRDGIGSKKFHCWRRKLNLDCEKNLTPKDELGQFKMHMTASFSTGIKV